MLAHEAENNLMVGLLNGIIMAGEFADEQPYMAAITRVDEVAQTVDASEKIVLTALRTPPHTLLPSYPDIPEEDTAAVLNLLLDDVQQVYETLTGTTGIKSLAKALASAWTERTGQAHHQSMSLRIYKLTEVIPPGREVAGAMREFTPDDFDRIAEWQYCFQTDCFGNGSRELSHQYAERVIKANPDTRSIFFWEVDGQPVAMAAYMGPTPNSFRIGAVYTPPEQRRKGYAGALVADVSQHVLNRNRSFATLFTDLANPTSNHVYQEVGYNPVCDVDEYKFEVPSAE
jgi:predicted GNAT family acetyltransferase